LVKLATGQGMVARLKDKGVAVKPWPKSKSSTAPEGSSSPRSPPTAQRRGREDAAMVPHLPRGRAQRRQARWRRGKDCRGDLPSGDWWQQASIIRHKDFVPHFAKDDKTFNMLDLLFFLFDGKKQLLNPVT
jgi:hypothetical protein